MFSAFFTYASKQRYDERNANVANRTGDLALLDGFFGSAQRVNTQEDRRDAARLVFDLCVRKNGYVPKAWHDTISAFLSYLSASGNKLMPFGGRGRRGGVCDDVLQAVPQLELHGQLRGFHAGHV
jgi:hypothetical protein